MLATKPSNLIPIRRKSQLPVARPVETNNVLSVNGKRSILQSWQDTNPVLGEQAPALATQEMEVPIIIIVSPIGLPQPKNIAITLTRIRCYTGAKKVRLEITAQVLNRINVTGREQRKAALSRSAMILFSW